MGVWPGCEDAPRVDSGLRQDPATLDGAQELKIPSRQLQVCHRVLVMLQVCHRSVGTVIYENMRKGVSAHPRPCIPMFFVIGSDGYLWLVYGTVSEG